MDKEVHKIEINQKVPSKYSKELIISILLVKEISASKVTFITPLNEQEYSFSKNELKLI